jgi:hypothetical protein
MTDRENTVAYYPFELITTVKSGINLMFGASPSGAGYTVRICSYLCNKYQTRLEMTDIKKDTSLLQNRINYGHQKLHSLNTRRA